MSHENHLTYFCNSKLIRRSFVSCLIAPEAILTLLFHLGLSDFSGFGFSVVVVCFFFFLNVVDLISTFPEKFCDNLIT